MTDHTIIITFDYCPESNTGCWVYVTDLGDRWHFFMQAGNDEASYNVSKSAGFRALLRECRRYWHGNAWIHNCHENRRAV